MYCRAKGSRLAKCPEHEEFFEQKNMEEDVGAQIIGKKLQLYIVVYKCPKYGDLGKVLDKRKSEKLSSFIVSYFQFSMRFFLAVD
jgi:hypothetical protein